MIDRAIQRDLLLVLQEKYPELVPANMLFDIAAEDTCTINLAYLEEHGLIECRWSRPVGVNASLVAAKITARGIDFIADDGGLSAILGIVTVKLHEDTVRDLLIKKVEASPAPETVKSKLVTQIKGLPAKGLETVATEGLKFGLDKVDDVIAFLQKLLP